MLNFNIEVDERELSLLRVAVSCESYFWAHETGAACREVCELYSAILGRLDCMIDDAIASGNAEFLPGVNRYDG